LGAAALFVCLAAATTAQAQSPDVEARRTALYREGVAAATSGRWAEAKERFAAALALRASPKVVFSLAQAEEQLGQLASASADYGRALEGARGSKEPEVVSAASQALAAVAPRVPHVRVTVAGAGQVGATATLDGKPFELAAATPVDPGAHRIVVSAPGMVTSETSFAVGEGQRLDVPLTLVPEAAPSAAAPSAPPAVAPAGAPVEGGAPPPAATETAATDAGPWRTVGLAIAGAGVVALGVGTYFAIEAKSKNDQSFGAGCGGADGNVCTSAGAQVRRDALSAATASTVAFVAGGVLAAGGIALWLAAPRAHAEGSAALAPVVLGPGGGLVMTGSW